MILLKVAWYRVIALFTLYFLDYDTSIAILALPCNRALCEHNKDMFPSSHDVTIMWLMFYLDTTWPETARSLAELSTIISVCFCSSDNTCCRLELFFYFLFFFAFVWDLVLIPYISWMASCCQKEGFLWLFLVCEKLLETIRLLVHVVTSQFKGQNEVPNKESILDLEPGTFYRKIKTIPF